jgi:hypothetical protein
VGIRIPLTFKSARARSREKLLIGKRSGEWRGVGALPIEKSSVHGHSTRELAPLKKTIYSLIDLREILLGCNRRYLEFLSAMDDTSGGERDLVRLTEPQHDADRTIKGLNFFAPGEQKLLRALQRPEFNIHGVRRADLKDFLAEYSTSRLSRELRRLRVLGLIKRVARAYRYYLTRLGRAAIAAACSLTQFQIIPALASAR